MKPKHIRFSELVHIAESKKSKDNIEHLKKCEVCLTGYAVAMALVSRSKQETEPVEIVLGEINSIRRGFSSTREAPEWEVVGKPHLLGAEIHSGSQGLSVRVVSDRYDIGGIKVKVYGRKKEDKKWTEYRAGETDKNGFILLNQVCENVISDSDNKYILSVQGVLRPKRENFLPHSKNLI